VDKLNDFLSFGEVQNVVINIEFAKVKIFQGILLLFMIYIFLHYYECCFELHYSSNIDKVQV